MVESRIRRRRRKKEIIIQVDKYQSLMMCTCYENIIIYSDGRSWTVEGADQRKPNIGIGVQVCQRVRSSTARSKYAQQDYGLISPKYPFLYVVLRLSLERRKSPCEHSVCCLLRRKSHVASCGQVSYPVRLVANFSLSTSLRFDLISFRWSVDAKTQSRKWPRLFVCSPNNTIAVVLCANQASKSAFSRTDKAKHFVLPLCTWGIQNNKTYRLCAQQH